MLLCFFISVFSLLFLLFGNIIYIIIYYLLKLYLKKILPLLYFLHKEKFLESVILFLKYIKYIYLYTSIPILFGSSISLQLYILNIY